MRARALASLGIILASMSMAFPSAALDYTTPQTFVIHLTTTNTSMTGAWVGLSMNISGDASIVYAVYQNGSKLNEGRTFVGGGNVTARGGALGNDEHVSLFDSATTNLVQHEYANGGTDVDVVASLSGNFVNYSWNVHADSWRLVRALPSHWITDDPGDGPAHAAVRAPSTRIDVPIHRALPIHIDHTLFAAVVPPLDAQVGGDVVVTGPQGRSTCPCFFDDITGPSAQGPGDYVVTWDGATVSAQPSILAAWADVDLS